MTTENLQKRRNGRSSRLPVRDFLGNRDSLGLESVGELQLYFSSWPSLSVLQSSLPSSLLIHFQTSSSSWGKCCSHPLIAFFSSTHSIETSPHLLLLSSFFLISPRKQAKHICAPKRLIASIVYFGSLVLTVIFALAV
jgi:hypothetical protein